MSITNRVGQPRSSAAVIDSTGEGTGSQPRTTADCEREELRPSVISRVMHRLSMATVLALLVVFASAIYGHWDGSRVRLSLMHSYVTEYMKLAPHWPWLTVASFVFAVLLQLLALGFLLKYRQKLLVLFGCLLLSSASMGTFFMAYAPVREAEFPPDSSHQWWAPQWWFTAATAKTAYEHGMADAYSDVHYRAIRLVLCSSLTGMLFLGTSIATTKQRGFARSTWLAVAAMSLLFIACDNIKEWHGLIQRTGFLIMYVWLWLAWHHCYIADASACSISNSQMTPRN